MLPLAVQLVSSGACLYALWSEARSDANAAEQLALGEALELESTRSELQDLSKGDVIAVFDERGKVTLQGSMHRLRKDGVVLNTSKDATPKLEAWFPVGGQRFILIQAASEA